MDVSDGALRKPRTQLKISPLSLSAQSQLKSQKWVYFCFFLSGMNGLIYEVSWLNQISLVMGHTVYSLVTTLAAYMTGLALGALFVPRLKRTGVNCLTLYLGAELLVGIYGLGFFPLLKVVQIPYGHLVSHFHFSLPALSVIQFFTCGTLILIPTFLMGTTLPLLAAFLYPKTNEISEKISVLYGFNTLGAMVGSFAAGYIILPNLGHLRAVEFAAAVNFSLYFIVTLFCRPHHARSDLSLSFEDLGTFFNKLITQASPPHPGTRTSGTTQGTKDNWSFGGLSALFVSGLSSILTQVIWGRLAALCFGSSVYIFTMITTLVLAGITLGSWLWRKAVTRTAHPWHFFTLIPLLASIALVIGNSVFVLSPRVVLWWFQEINPGFWLKTTFEFGLSFLCLLPGATLLGTLFPASIAWLTRKQDLDAGTQSLAIGYSMNIVGLLVGAVLGSFFLADLGIEGLAEGLEVILLILSLVLALEINQQPLQGFASLAIGGLVIFLASPFDWDLLNSGAFYNRDASSNNFVRNVGWLSQYDYFRAKFHHTLATRDDPHATIAIQEDLGATYRLFKINGKIDGNAIGEGAEFLLALYPALVKVDFRSSLIVGLGAGYTAELALQYPKMERVKVIELSSAMIDFSKQFLPYTGAQFWKDSRLEIENRDGREYLEHTPERFDLILSEPSNPWVNGTASLFTEEYFDTVAKRLTPAGIAGIWFHTYGLDCTSVMSVLTAAAHSFASLLVFQYRTDIYILGSSQSGEMPVSQMPPEAVQLQTKLFSKAKIPEELTVPRAYIHLIEKTLLYDRPELLKFSILMPANRDDNQLLQFRAGKTFFSTIACQDFAGARNPHLVSRLALNLITF